MGCPFDCSYCYLQQYQNFPGIILPSNTKRFQEYFCGFIKKIKKPIRIGTGEFCDSLALDDNTNYSLELVPFFARQNVLFELKTKSVNINNLLKIRPARNIIVSWSLNSARVAREELAAASLPQRIAASAKIQKYGYSVAFHFDPVVYYQGWEKDYQNTIEKLYANLKPAFAWISIGSLRANRRLKPIVEERFPQSKVFYTELVIGEDKKLRYPEFLRVEMYKSMVKWIRKYDRKTPIYLCMEQQSVWQKTGLKLKAQSIEEYLIAKNKHVLKKW